MPRVSAEHLEQRRLQIMDAAQRCFARNGFYETSMQDVFTECGLSAGAVYRYFKSKNELIQAISARVFERFASIIETALAREPFPGPVELLGALAVAAEEFSAADGPARIALPAWASALHDPALATTVRGRLTAMRAHCVRAAEQMQGHGRIPPGADPDAVGAVLLALLPGFLVQHLILEDLDAATFQRGLWGLLPAIAGSGA